MINPASPDNLLQRWRKPAAILIVSLLLHVLVFDWIGHGAGHPVTRPRSEPVMMTTLLEPEPLPAPVEAPKPTPAPPRKPRTVVTPPPKPAAATPAVVAPEPVIVASATPVPAVAPAPEPEPVVAPVTQPVSEPVATTPATEPVRTFKTAAPPSVDIKYDVQALRDGKTVYGSGKIGWRDEGDRYAISGEAGVLFFTVLGFRSEGSLDASGITPLRYSEKRFRKAETNTHFQRDNPVISFSSSSATYPRQGGEQDRASIVWQLAAIGRGDATQIAAGTELAIFVAGVRDAETWHIKVLGEETLALGGEQLATWHFLRTPRPGAYDTQVEFWLAPARDWYPVRLRQTEPNGNTLDMTMSSVTPLAAR